MEILGLPVLTEVAAFRDLSIGEDFYLPGEAIRYCKASDTTAQMSPTYQFQTYAQVDFQQDWKVWRRIEP